ncbi:hypothetical protein ACET9W_15020, partial [Aeromonas veronii]
LMMNPFSWLQMTNMISYQGLVRTFPKARYIFVPKFGWSSQIMVNYKDSLVPIAMRTSEKKAATNTAAFFDHQIGWVR